MFKLLAEKVLSKTVATAAEGAMATATGGASVWIRAIVWCLENPLVILFAVTTIVFGIMYGCERGTTSTLTKDKAALTAELTDTKVRLASAEIAVDTCKKSSDTYKGNYESCRAEADKKQLAYGDLVSIIQRNCANQQKIDDAVKKAESQKKTTGTYSASDLIGIYNDMIKARSAAMPAPAPAGGHR